MIYENKKTGLKAKFVEADKQRKTTILEYTTGEEVGKSVCVTDSTLKRWWRKTDEEESVLDSIDMEQVNKPYKPDVTPHYIPKPQSVIDYEEKKRKRHNSDIPEFEKIVEDFGELLKKVNETSQYAYFHNGSTIWRKSGYISMYVIEEYWEKLTNEGLKSSPNKDDSRPFGFEIRTADDYSKVLSALL